MWADVTNWNKWDHDVAYSSLVGKFAVGSRGILKPKSGPKATFQITDCEPLQSFTDSTNLPLAKIHFIHEMNEAKGTLSLTHTIKISGPLGFLFARILGKQFKESLPKAMSGLVKLAIEKNKRYEK